ncbi:arsenate reductase (glutaredoxin) [Pseudoalteromonas tunicata]|jgi:arsenate reductase|uniref:Arsenate reductase n=1 Tax=Pseudoalteromonas tunicata D2 TaxID=87626 RepID=A4CBB6_9GAMM|nr:arsenate reductase (glutaredoxin) [Pseudoalteromonas tunicata]ATC94208.1 arsenate reductase [Pseudoalteromonas tunicata]AXT29968.1 arsenate reductase (glutaredoxin) [Pseudoalteromonas tunicata]EAR27653.1 putative arsenate reductase with thioredoxin-like domain [Pseudoalteromonas tunicata D2]MDP4983036.1 arsenate reductase (glutaredoxin) [Pseudoalteromonas tunicata]MDP5211436.1 arsenate reductase (glutaredoxin) [Pseudoalteromonas tunicata]
MSIKIYHNPRCSKSRETLSLLGEHQIQAEIIEYLATPPSIETLKTIIAQLGYDSARQLMRTKEDLYKELGLKDESNEEALIAAMHQYPKLIERPIVVHGEKAAVGRPPESVLVLF